MLALSTDTAKQQQCEVDGLHCILELGLDRQHIFVLMPYKALLVLDEVDVKLHFCTGREDAGSKLIVLWCQLATGHSFKMISF